MFNNSFIFSRTLIAILITLICFIMDAPFVSSEAQYFEGNGTCIMGNSGVENVAISQGKARELALRDAQEQAGIFMSSITEVKNNKLSKDEIRMISVSILKVIEDTPSMEPIPNEPNAVRFKCHVKVLIDPDDFVKMLPDLTKEKIENQVIMNQDQDTYNKQNEEEIVDLREQYKNASDENKRKEIVVAIKHNEEKVTAAQLYQRGAECYGRNDYEGAIAKFNEAIKMNADYAAPWTGLGWIYNEQKQYEKAIECFQKSIEKYDKVAVPYNGLAYAYNYKGDYNRAIEYSKKAIELDDKYAAAHNNLGYAYKKLNQTDKAIEFYNKAMAIDPNDDTVLANIGNVYYEQKDFPKALQYYQKSTDINANHANVWYNLGHIYGQKGEIDKAIDSYNKVTKLDPQNIRALILLGYLYNNQKKFEDAKRCFKKAIKIKADDASAWSGLGFAYNGSEDYSNSYEAYKKAVELDPNNQTYQKNLEMVKKKL